MVRDANLKMSASSFFKAVRIDGPNPFVTALSMNYIVFAM
jgi:hypothetical protein